MRTRVLCSETASTEDTGGVVSYDAIAVVVADEWTIGGADVIAVVAFAAIAVVSEAVATTAVVVPVTVVATAPRKLVGRRRVVVVVDLFMLWSRVRACVCPNVNVVIFWVVVGT